MNELSVKLLGIDINNAVDLKLKNLANTNVVITQASYWFC